MDTSPASPTLTIGRNRWATLLVGLLTLTLGAAVAAWYATHPAPLTTGEAHVTAVTSVGQPVYVGVWTLAADSGRRLDVAGVKVTTEATTPVEVEPLLCRGGSVGVTSDPSAFCTSVTAPAGETMEPGDSVVLRIVGADAGAAFTERVRVSYREGLRAATQPAGTRVVTAVVPGTS